MANIIQKIKDSLQEEESEWTKARFGKIENSLSNKVKGFGVSWGLIILGAFAVYAIINLLISLSKLV